MIKIMERGRDAKVNEVGTVDRKDGKVVFDLPQSWIDRLQEIQFRGKTYTPEDGQKFMDVLPFYLSGDRVWATPDR